MAPNRKQAKLNITETDQNAQEFNEALLRAHNFQLELDREKNRHLEGMKERELGWIGKIFGDGKNASSLLATICVISGICGFFGCLILSVFAKANIEFWSENASRCLSLTLTALAYIFGKSAASSK